MHLENNIHIIHRQSKSNASCSWIIRALWRINEEVKEKAFPTFMNHNSIKFMLDVYHNSTIFLTMDSLQRNK